MSRKIEDGLTREQRYRKRHDTRERTREYVSAMRARDPEEARRKAREYYAKNAARLREKAKVKYQRQRVMERTPEEVEVRRLKDRIDKAKRRLLAGAANSLTPGEWKGICEKHAHRCAYCGRSGPLEQDHVIPLSKGGDHTKENVVPACKSCNASKGNRSDRPIHVSHGTISPSEDGVDSEFQSGCSGAERNSEERSVRSSGGR